MSLEEMNLPPSEVGVPISQPPIAWAGEDPASVASEPNSEQYSTWESSQNLSYLEEVRELTEKLTEMKLGYETELNKYKQQLENQQIHEEQQEELRTELVRREQELKAMKQELKIAKEKNEEYQQEIWLRGMNSLPPSMSSTSSSPETSELLMLRNKADEYKAELDRKEEELKVVRGELGRKEVELRREFDRKEEQLKLELDKKDSELRMARRDSDGVRRETNEDARSSEKRMPRIARRTEHKLEAALKKEKELEEKLRACERECEQKEQHLGEVLEEKSVLEFDMKSFKDQLSEKESELEQMVSHVQQLQSDLESESRKRVDIGSELTKEIKDLKHENREQSVAISQLEESNRNLQGDIQIRQQREMELEESSSILGSQLNAVCGERDKLGSQLKSVCEERDQLQSVCGERDRLLKERKVEEGKKAKEMSELKTKVHDLEKEKVEAENLCDGFKDEAIKTIEDYNKLSNQLGQAQQEIIDLRKKNSQCLSQLSVRTEEAQKLARERDELKDSLSAMQLQMKMYESDFNEERRSREKAALTVEDLSKRVKTLEKDKKELRERLNSQTASQCHQEFASEDFSQYSTQQGPPLRAGAMEDPYATHRAQQQPPRAGGPNEDLYSPVRPQGMPPRAGGDLYSPPGPQPPRAGGPFQPRDPQPHMH